MTTRRALAVLAGGAAALSIACSTPTDSGPPLIALLGTWDYTAHQTSPTTATDSGTLTITSQAGNTFRGVLAVTETDSAGSHPWSGIVSGVTPDSMSVDFDVFVASLDRRHLAAVAHDSMKTGTWVEETGTGALSGTFAAVRRP